MIKFMVIAFGAILLILGIGEIINQCGPNQPLKRVTESEIKRTLSAEGLTAEQNNIKRRLELSSDPNKIWWIYCLGDNGQVVSYGAVKGKITSSHKYLSMTSGDGTLGESDSYVYWFDPSGSYYQWSGLYFVSSKEVKINDAILNMRSVEQ
jgi:hypothetical protein